MNHKRMGTAMLMHLNEAGDNNVHLNGTVILTGFFTIDLFEKLILWCSKFCRSRAGPSGADKMPSYRRCGPKSK